MRFREVNTQERLSLEEICEGQVFKAEECSLFSNDTYYIKTDCDTHPILDLATGLLYDGDEIDIAEKLFYLVDAELVSKIRRP